MQNQCTPHGDDMATPSLQEWKQLYDAAREFQKLECWNWMWDSDVFGVQNPETDEIGYCCVMGMLGQHFALGAYLGSEGLEGYLRIQSGERLPHPDFLFTQRLLMASFEDREILHKQDLRIIKDLGLTCRGRNSWPLFRSYLPGYVPWFLTSDEAVYLTLALNQAIDVCLRFKDDPELLNGTAENQYLVRVLEKEEKKWVDTWAIPRPVEKQSVTVRVDENRLRKIKKIPVRRSTVWEIDYFYSPEAVRDKKERPWYPCIILWVDRYTRVIPHIYLARPTEFASEFVEQFLNVFERFEILPQEIVVEKKEIFRLLKPIASQLGTTVKKVRKLSVMEEVKADLSTFHGM